MAEIWKIDYLGNESLVKQFHCNCDAKDFIEEMSTRGFAHKLVAIDADTDEVIAEYVPNNW